MATPPQVEHRTVAADAAWTISPSDHGSRARSRSTCPGRRPSAAPAPPGRACRTRAPAAAARRSSRAEPQVKKRVAASLGDQAAQQRARHARGPLVPSASVTASTAAPLGAESVVGDHQLGPPCAEDRGDADAARLRRRRRAARASPARRRARPRRCAAMRVRGSRLKPTPSGPMMSSCRPAPASPARACRAPVTL